MCKDRTSSACNIVTYFTLSYVQLTLLVWIHVIYSISSHFPKNCSKINVARTHHTQSSPLSSEFSRAWSSLWPLYEQYLKPRKFKVSINNTHSKEQTINYSVPQGSIQGAFLFNTYASTISDVIPTTLELMGYADDHWIKKPFKPGTPTAIQNLTPSPS